MIHDQAVCLRLMDWSETSQIAVLFTEQHGKIAATAKGAKRQTPSTLAKFSGGVDLLTSAEAVIVVGRRDALWNLIEWDLRDPHWHLRRDLNAHRLGMYAADLLHHLLQEHDPHPVAFIALRDFLAALARPEDQASALLRFQWRLVEDLGYKPVLDRDAQTGEPLDARAKTLAFSARAGGTVADTGASDRWRVRRSTLNVLRAVAEEKAVEDDPAIHRANKLICVYFRAILDRQLPTMRYVLTE